LASLLSARARLLAGSVVCAVAAPVGAAPPLAAGAMELPLPAVAALLLALVCAAWLA